MRVAYVWPSGEIQANRFASSFWALNPLATVETRSNNGDLFVTEASLLLTTPKSVECFDPARITDRMVEHINSDFDVIFVRGANTLSDEAYATILANFLERMQIGVVVMGIGIQAPSLAKLPRSKDVMRLAKLLGERSKVVGVRGQITADFMEQHGVHNLQIIGCPSILRHNTDSLHLDKPEWSQLKSFGFSLTRYYSGLYQREPKTFVKVQSRLIKELHALGRVGIITQVEKEERAFAYRNSDAMRSAEEKLRQEGWFDAEMEKIYKTRSVFFGTRASDYDMHVRNFDLILGTRLHTNAMAVACGIPAITLTFDLRVSEIYEFWRLPAIQVEEAGNLSVREIYESADFDAFNSRIGYVYHNFREYLEANGVSHVMSSGS